MFGPCAAVQITEIAHFASDFVGGVDEALVFSGALFDVEIAALASGSTSSLQDTRANLPSLGVRYPHGAV